MSMFENYNKSTKFSDNRPKPKIDCDLDKIVIGGTVEHNFKLQFRFSDLINGAAIYYKQTAGLEFYIPVTPEMVYEKGNCSLITVELGPEITSQFKDALCDTYCQIKFYKKDGTIEFGERYYLQVLKPLDSTADVPVFKRKFGLFNGSLQDFLAMPNEMLAEGTIEPNWILNEATGAYDISMQPTDSSQVLYFMMEDGQEDHIMSGILNCGMFVTNFTKQDIIDRNSPVFTANQHYPAQYGTKTYNIFGIYSPVWRSTDELIINTDLTSKEEN